MLMLRAYLCVNSLAKVHFLASHEQKICKLYVFCTIVLSLNHVVYFAEQQEKEKQLAEEDGKDNDSGN